MKASTPANTYTLKVKNLITNHHGEEISVI